jgi:hypothetical protein
MFKLLLIAIAGLILTEGHRCRNEHPYLLGDMMKLTLALIFAFLSTTVVYAETYNYSCKVCVFPTIGYDCEVDGKTYPLRVDDNKNVLEWRGKKYSLTEQPNCANMGGTQKVTELPLTSALRHRDMQPSRIRTEMSKSNAILKGDRGLTRQIH